MIEKRVLLPYTEKHEIYSKTVNDTFQISVALPKKYNQEFKYPVLYLTDANIFFGLFAETSWLLQYGKEIPEIIVVGIGYPDETKHLELRNRDLTPTQYNLKGRAGKAKDFLSFIIYELKPEIESLYSIDSNDSILAGDSFGGLFSLYAMLSKTNEFNRYIIGNPSLYWDNSIIFEMEKEYSMRTNSLPAKVFLSVGQLEALTEPEHARMLSNVARLIEILNSRKYVGLSLKSHIFLNESHLSVIPATFSRGLREVFNLVLQID